MPLTADLLNPIPGTNPSGQYLRYILYDKIKEARREEDDSPHGDWAHERKKADYPMVLRLCTDALATKSKDVQLAVWLAEASFRLEGLAALQNGLELIFKLVDAFWDTIYPELEDGDAELRATPLEWLGSKFKEQLVRLPLTNSGLDSIKYKESRVVGYETEAAGNDAKQQAREHAINDGKLTAEKFDEALSKTPKVFYEEKLREADGCLAALEMLGATCDSRFQEYRPSFVGLREGLEDIRLVITALLQKKREQEPEPRAEPTLEAASVLEESPLETNHLASDPEYVATSTKPISKDPESPEDAIERIVLATRYLRRERPCNPVPYLVLRALRWGEIRANAGDLDASLLEAPLTEIRKRLRHLLQDGEWQELLESNEAAMESPCGRAWLDLQRYAVRASEALGDSYLPVSAAIVSGLKALLSDYPQLSHSMLNDETPAASPETQTWLAELTALPEREFADSPAVDSSSENPSGEDGCVDAYELAKNAASSGRPEQAIEILEREAAHERSGRGRFQRRMQLAQICIGAGHPSIALPILEALAGEIDERNLEHWEAPDVVIHALGLLYQCLEKLKRNPEQREKIYARICRLGPAQALELAK
jgi:type VI secretion system protein ImpA